MYTEKELRAAKVSIRRIARENHVAEARVREDIEIAINRGRLNPDPEVQARWATFRYAGSEPTAEEFILWVASMTKGILGQ